MPFNRKRFALIVCLLVSAVLGVLYGYTRFGRHQHDDAAHAEPGTFAHPSLKSVAVLFRHGERAPFAEYITYPNIFNKNDFPEGKGQLTKIGKQHMYQKGKLLRRLYNGFIGDFYWESEISIKTTNMSRTFMSAEMVLAGMYPPKDYQKWSELETVWQPIPISNDSPDRTVIINDKCPYSKIFLQEYYDQVINEQNNNQIDELLSYLTEKCRQPIKVKQIITLYDIFLSKLSNRLRFPEWIQPNHIQIMESVSIKLYRSIYRNQKLQKLITGPLLREISLNMGLRSNNSKYNTAKDGMHLYAGHDLSLGTAMYFLANNSIKMPDFGASIHFHLYLDKVMGYIIKVFYYDKWDDEKGQTIPIPFCGSPCQLEDFTKLIEDNFSTEWEIECKKVQS